MIQLPEVRSCAPQTVIAVCGLTDWHYFDILDAVSRKDERYLMLESLARLIY